MVKGRLIGPAWKGRGFMGLDLIMRKELWALVLGLAGVVLISMELALGIF